MLLSVCLGVTCLIGDNLVERFSNFAIFKAICDNFTHGLIGFLSAFLIVSELRDHVLWNERSLLIAACTIVSSLIDIDHFIAARSWNLSVGIKKDIFIHYSK